MTPIAYRPLMFAGAILLALPACAPSSSATPPLVTNSPAAVDLGPSTRIARTQPAMAWTGHEAPRVLPGDEINDQIQPVRDGGDDARATGIVNSVDPAQHKINLSHGPIPSIGWPAMTMDFSVAPSIDLSRVRPGSKVNFSIQKGKGGMYEVQSVQPAGAGQ